MNLQKSLAIVLLSTLHTVSIAQMDTVFIRTNATDDVDLPIYETDTILFFSPWERRILIGTCIMPSTENQMEAYGYGLWFESIEKSDCQSHGEEVYYNADRINYIEKTDSTLKIDLNIFTNCCYDFLCDYSVDSTGTLNLIYHGYGSFCACDCCFGLTYNIRISPYPDARELSYVQLNGDLTTRKKIQ
jgi:hypothetical protein